MIEVYIEGHDKYSEYNTKIKLHDSTTISELLEMLKISEKERDSLLVIKDNKVVSKSNIIRDNDIIKLYSVHFGG